MSFQQGRFAALNPGADSPPVAPFHGTSASFSIAPTDKQGRDLRAQGRLQYVGQHYLRFAETGQYFLKVGADAPETLLAYADFDGTVAGNPARCHRSPAAQKDCSAIHLTTKTTIGSS